MTINKLSKLAGFVNSLESIDFKFNVNSFDHRLKLQKLVYLARKFGLDLSYSYNLYIHGPYSPTLADDYYKLGEELNENSVVLPDGFFNLVRGKSEKWLEYAATLIMIDEKNSGLSDEDKINLVLRNKPWAHKHELNSILGELKKHGVIS